MRVRELPRQARLAYPRLAHHRDNLAVALACPPQRLAQQLDLHVATHKAHEPARSGGMEAAADRARTRKLEDLDRRRQPLHWYRAARGDLHEALGEGQRLRSQQVRPRLGHLLHARGEVRTLADRRVVHMQIRADRADYYLAVVQSDADLDGDAGAAEDALGVLLHALLHAECRVTSPH